MTSDFTDAHAASQNPAQNLSGSEAGDETIARQIIEAVPVPIFVSKLEDGTFLFCSKAAQDLLGTPRRDYDIFAEAEERDQIYQTVLSQEKVQINSATMLRGDGALFSATLSVRMIEIAGVPAAVSHILDLTEMDAVQTEMTRQREALHQSEKLSALGELLAGVAHELNNPLSVVVGQAMMLEEFAPDEQSRKRAQKITAAAERCARIVKTFLAMARNKPAQKQAVDLVSLIQGCLDITAYALKSADVAVECDFEEGLPKIWIDHDQMAQVFSNLVINAQQALMANKDDRQLFIKIERSQDENDQIILRFHDNGPGIARENQARVFDPFFTTKDVGEGTGIGLAFCHRVITAHEGSIRLDWAPLGGACFVVTLPVGQEEPASLGGAQDEERGGACKILLVDDEKDVAELHGELCEAFGHHVRIALSGGEALRYLGEEEFDLILSDVRMAGLDGAALLREIERLYPHMTTRFGFITGDIMSPHMRGYLDQSGRPFLEKPVLPLALKEFIAHIISADEET